MSSHEDNTQTEPLGSPWTPPKGRNGVPPSKDVIGASMGLSIPTYVLLIRVSKDQMKSFSNLLKEAHWGEILEVSKEPYFQKLDRQIQSYRDRPDFLNITQCLSNKGMRDYLGNQAWRKAKRAQKLRENRNNSRKLKVAEDEGEEAKE